MNYCKTGLNKFGLMAVAGKVEDVKDGIVTLNVTENLRQADGKWGNTKRVVACDMSKAGGVEGIEKGQNFCAIGYGRPDGDNMTMEAKAAGTGNCRIEITETATGRVKSGNAWIDEEKPFVFGMVMGDANYTVDTTKKGQDRIRAQFHIEEPYDKLGANVIVSDKATWIARNDDKSKAQFDRFVKHLDNAAEKAGLTANANAQHTFEGYPFESVFLFREDAEKYKTSQFSQIGEYTADSGKNEGTVYYFRSEFMYQPDFANFGYPDMEKIKAREEETKAFNDRDAAREEKTESPAKDEAVYDDPFKELEDDNPFGMNYEDLPFA